MSLNDFAMPGVSTNIEPELAARLLKLLNYFGGRVVIASGYRSHAEQQALYDAWIATGKTDPPSVAVPGFSLHERDPAQAADLHRTDPTLTWGAVHYTAAAYGLCFPINREDWHTQADPAWIPQPEDDDMNKEETSAAFGARIPTDGPFAGMICVDLINDQLSGTDPYPLAVAIGFVHQELKMKRLKG